MKYELKLEIEAVETEMFFITANVLKNGTNIVSIVLTYHEFKQLFTSGALQSLKTAYNVCVFNDNEARDEIIDMIKRELNIEIRTR